MSDFPTFIDYDRWEPVNLPAYRHGVFAGGGPMTGDEMLVATEYVAAEYKSDIEQRLLILMFDAVREGWRPGRKMPPLIRTVAHRWIPQRCAKDQAKSKVHRAAVAKILNRRSLRVQELNRALRARGIFVEPRPPEREYPADAKGQYEMGFA